jgi:hypothetical protein
VRARIVVIGVTCRFRGYGETTKPILANPQLNRA